MNKRTSFVPLAVLAVVAIGSASGCQPSLMRIDPIGASGQPLPKIETPSEGDVYKHALTGFVTVVLAAGLRTIDHRWPKKK